MAEPNGDTSQPPSASPSSPHSYPSPEMQPAYTYQAPHGHPSSEAYRQPPNAMVAAVNLPPLRSTVDGQLHHQPHHPSISPQVSMPPMHQYYPPIPTSTGYGALPAQAISPHGMPLHHLRAIVPGFNAEALQRMTGRPKKEIKRRTKTGCLTCRKRRIKCDEQRPVCRNCTKSKRECQGYDPLFKNPSPTTSGRDGTSGSTASSNAAEGSSPTAMRPDDKPKPTLTSSAPQQPLPAARPLQLATASPSVPPTTAKPIPSLLQTSAIDPALSSAANPLPSTTTIGQPRAPQPIMAGSDLDRPIKIEDLFISNGHVPYPVSEMGDELSADRRNDIRILWSNEFGPGLNALFETNWYTRVGLLKLFSHRKSLHLVSCLLDRYANPLAVTDEVVRSKTRALESKITWDVLSIPTTIQDKAPGATSDEVGSSDIEGSEVYTGELKQRCTIVEFLLTGKTTDTNPMSKIDYTKTGHPLSDAKKEQIQFWQTVADFISEPRDKPESSAKIESILHTARGLLSGNENRDVIYSIMVVSHLGPKVRGAALPAYVNGQEESDHSKVHIAKRFLIREGSQMEAQSIPMRTICYMAVESWGLRGL